MENERDVVNLLSIFSLTIEKALGLSESVSTRVMLLYDKEENVKRFMIFNRNIEKDLNRRIRLWLEANIDIHDMIRGLNSNNIDADKYGQVY